MKSVIYVAFVVALASRSYVAQGLRGVGGPHIRCYFFFIAHLALLKNTFCVNMCQRVNTCRAALSHARVEESHVLVRERASSHI